MQLVRTVKENDHDLDEQLVNTVIRSSGNRNTLHRAGPAASGLALISVDFGRFGAGTVVLGLPVAAAVRLTDSVRR